MNVRNEKIFTGPLFIVGMPRSGTKLLRAILNEHPGIGIPDIETNFLHIWIHNWHRYGDLSKRNIFNKFYRKMLRFSYFKYMAEGGRLIQDDVWYKLCKNFTPAGVFESLIRHDADVGYDSIKIWGDKSPNYIRFMPLVKKTFPEARFLHIIRDVRDYCLSINRAWRKNMTRAAQRWCDDLEQAKYDSRNFHNDYLEVRYEDLITEPDQILIKISDFLEVDFDPKIIYLSNPAEFVGDARGMLKIKKDNKGKYKYLMELRMRRKIESITAPVLKSYGYFVEYSGENKRIKSIKMLYYQLIDGVNLFKFDMRESGLLEAIKRNLNIFMIKVKNFSSL